MMDDAELLLRGILLGLAVAAPVGPIGVLCIQRCLAGGFWAGFSGGIGTAVADAVYAALAAAGFAALAGVTGPVQDWLRWGGAALIAWLGWRAMTARPATQGAAAQAAVTPAMAPPLRLLVVTFLLTMSNPTTILSFAALFAALGLAAGAPLHASVAAVAGVFAGSLLWWAILSGTVSLLRQRISDESRHWINRIAGFALIAFAVALIV
ncbi:LysE family translocator [Ferrovibrio xuzhouensis]|uniref:LysE family translocator n=1 Tax=Ferrovibrio xuzhouensis TaxID=1576914 RepID=A0ABV7VHI3_9PROT